MNDHPPKASREALRQELRGLYIEQEVFSCSEHGSTVCDNPNNPECDMPLKLLDTLLDITMPLIQSAQQEFAEATIKALPEKKHSASGLNEDMNADMMEIVGIKNKGFNEALDQSKSAIKATLNKYVSTEEAE